MFANIIIDITHEKLDKIFQYRIPSELEGMLEVGAEVEVPFGRGNRLTKGYIIGFSETCDYDLSKVKAINGLAEKSVGIEAKLVALAAWMKEHYGGTMIQALKTVLPIKRQESAKVKRQVRLLLSKEEAEEKLLLYQKKNQKARARLLEALLRDGTDGVLPYELVVQKLNITRTVVRALEEQNVLALESENVFRNPLADNPGIGADQEESESSEKAFSYTTAQKEAIQTVWNGLKAGQRTWLIHGVTGSGKTALYIEWIKRTVSEGRQAIVLIPEIALTYQTVMRFYHQFGDRVSIMNSRLSAGERYDQMVRAKEGKIDVMIGPRSALFTPFPNLGLIVIDEEHETTYKSEQVPRYHARETAIRRAELEDAGVILGSATPSLEAMYRARNGEYGLITLTERAKAHAKMAQVEVVDMRAELKEGNHSILSHSLYEKMEQRLKDGEQIMLFLNRRGYAGFLSCRECGHVIKCPHCDVSLSTHRGGKLVCHYCGHEEYKPLNCPECGSKHLGEFKVGTQQVEDVVQKMFPQTRVLRMDLDTTRNKNGHEEILSAFANEEAQILIGTQMIVKGHDFPNVTLVGALAADMSLYADDYRAGERTFQILTQAVGRSGRGEKAGEAVIQTYSPDHYAIQTAAAQDYEGFYEQEMYYREMMGYPPVEHLLAVLLSCEEESLLEKGASYLKTFAERAAGKAPVQIIGPASPSIGKINDIYRKVLYLKTEKYDTLVKMKNRLEQYIEINSGYQKIRIQFDFDPMHL